MSRECRRVTPNWNHPKNDRGRYQPMYDQSYQDAVAEWKDGYAAWERGERPKHTDAADEYWDYAGSPPDREYYRPHWSDAERTHYQMYETCSEGTPISPVFATPEEVARWCADNGASAFADMTAPYEHWLSIARGGWAPSMVMDNGVMKSGVQFVAENP